MVKEYFLTYRHVNGQLMRKRLTKLDLEEVSESPFVAEVIAKTEIDFGNYQKSLEEHKKKEQKYMENKREHDATDDLPKHEENRHDYGTEKGEPPAE